jgi:diacylglycerol kinase family enzyme
MRSRFYLADNPSAGYGSRRKVEAVLEALRRAGAAVTRATAACEGDASTAMIGALASGSYDALLVAGGDGSIRLGAKAALGTGIPLGVIPLGTGNVLAHEVGLPTSAAAIAALLLEGEVRAVHAARANGELFLLMAGIGFDGRIIGDLDMRLKQRVGKLAYAGPTLRALARAPDVLEVAVDDAEPVQAAWVVVANAGRYAGAFMMAPGTSIERPELQAILFAGTRADRLRQLAALARGHLEAEATRAGRTVAILPCRKVAVRARQPVPVQLDGDAFGATPVAIEATDIGVPMILPARRVAWPTPGTTRACI